MLCAAGPEVLETENAFCWLYLAVFGGVRAFGIQLNRRLYLTAWASMPANFSPSARL